MIPSIVDVTLMDIHIQSSLKSGGYDVICALQGVDETTDKKVSPSSSINGGHFR